MQRRTLLAALASIGAAVGGAASRAKADVDRQGSDRPTPDQMKVMYHLNDLDRVALVLGNIHNHIAGAGGPDHVSIVLVVHGAALRAFHAATAAPDIRRQTEQLVGSGLGLTACANTMKAQQISLPELVAGFSVAGTGAMVRIAELQSQGYVYIRP